MAASSGWSATRLRSWLLGFFLRRLPLGARLNHGQRYASPLPVHAQHPYRHDVAHRDDFIRALDISIRHLADVHEAAIFQADVDERPKIDHVQNRALQLHGGLQILKLEDALFENRRGQVFAGISAGPAQRFDNVPQRR